MNALVLSGPDFSLDTRPTPTPGDHDALVEVHAAGLNAADLLQRQGIYPAPTGWPQDIPGLELAGVVTAVGAGVDSAWVGQRVCAIVGGGGQATHAIVPATHLIPVPDSVSWVEAGGFAEAFVTAYDALVTQADLRAGERVLISGASGGVGTAALQIARLRGAHVTAVTRHLEHADTLRELGADVVVSLEEIDQIAPVDVVLELVGAAHLNHALHRLAPFARVVVIGVGGGATVSLDLRLLMTTRARLMASTLRARSRDEKTRITAEVTAALGPAWTRGELAVPIAATFPLSEANEAYAFFAQPGKIGKVVFLPTDA